MDRLFCYASDRAIGSAGVDVRGGFINFGCRGGRGLDYITDAGNGTSDLGDSTGCNGNSVPNRIFDNRRDFFRDILDRVFNDFFDGLNKFFKEDGGPPLLGRGLLPPVRSPTGRGRFHRLEDLQILVGFFPPLLSGATLDLTNMGSLEQRKAVLKV